MNKEKIMLYAITGSHNVKALERALDIANDFLECGAVVYVKVKGKDDFVKLEKIETKVMIMPFI